MIGAQQDLVESLTKLTEEISKLTAPHMELRKKMQAIHELFKAHFRANNIVIYNFPEKEKHHICGNF